MGRAEMTWEPIPGWPRYDINLYGVVKSADMHVRAKNGGLAIRKGRILRQVIKANGYAYVTLTSTNKRAQLTVHSLVARTFIGPRPVGMNVLHTDGDKTNNYWKNLRYATQAENHADTLVHGRRPRGSKHPAAALNEQDVLAIRASKLKGVDLATAYGVTTSHISSIRSRRVWKHI
jgi:hypothetical protein